MGAQVNGNFLGQYIGIGMDQLRYYLALLAKHIDVQISLLVAPEFNGGPPGMSCIVYRQSDVYYESGKNMHSASNRTRKPVQVINVEFVPVTFTGPTLIRPDAGRGLLRREHRKNLRAAGGS